MRSLRRFRALVPLLIVVLLTLSPVSAGAQTKEDAEEAKAAAEAAYDALVEANARLDEALIEYEAINGELVDLNWRIEQLFSRVSDYEDDAISLRERARSMVIEAYMSGGSADMVQVALEADSIQDVVTSQVLITRATEHDIVDLDRLDAVSREMERLKGELEENQARVQVLRDEALVVVEELDAAQQAAADAYAKADAEAREAYRKWQEEEKRRRLAELARKQGAAGGVGDAITPGFVCPVKGGSSFINSWGFPRSGGRTHKGTDLFAPRGTPLVAVAPGVVMFKTNTLGGIVAYVFADYGVKYYYAHLDGYKDGVRSGQRVSAGQVIGYVGNTGNALGTSPHLHFQLHPGGGAPVNPYPTLARHSC